MEHFDETPECVTEWVSDSVPARRALLFFRCTALSNFNMFFCFVLLLFILLFFVVIS